MFSAALFTLIGLSLSLCLCLFLSYCDKPDYVSKAHHTWRNFLQ